MNDGIRRVVTGHDQDGKAVVVSDARATKILTRAGVAITNLWQSSEMPADFNGPTETVDGPVVLTPPPRGTVFRIIEFLPEIPPGLPPSAFMKQLEAVIEPRSNALMAEAGFPLSVKEAWESSTSRNRPSPSNGRSP